MAAKKTSAKKTPTPTKLDTNPITLGPLAAQVKAKATPAQWRQLVKGAHKRGFAINSYLDTSVPDALKQRTKASLAKQAQTTVNSAYAPAMKELSQQESRIKAISDKRAKDDVYYRDWLARKNAEVATQQQVATQQMSDAIGNLNAQTAAAYQASPGQVAGELSQVPGSVSDYSQSKALSVDLSQAQIHNLAGLAAQGNAANATAAIGDKNLAQTQANSYAFLAAQAAKQNSATFQELAKIGDAKQKLVLDKAAASSKEVARLLDQEISKASENRNYAAAAEKLGIAADANQLKLKGLLANIADDQADNDRADAQLAEQQRHNREAEEARNIQLGINKRNSDINWYKARHPKKAATKGSSKGGKKGSGNTSTDPQERFDYAYSLLLGSRDPSTKKPFTRDYVGLRRDRIVAQLVTETKISREMAVRVVRAFLFGNMGNPGSYKDWAKEPNTTPKSETVENGLGSVFG